MAIDVNAGAESRYRFVGFAASSADASLQVRAVREAGCTPCGDSTALDACLVGRWQQTGGAPS